MRKILILSVGLMLSTAISAQKLNKDNVPVTVQSGFMSKYDKAEKVQWEMDYDNYSADFIQNKIEITAVFDKDGTWLWSRRFMKVSELPGLVKETILKEFGELKGYTFDNILKIEETGKDPIYEFDAVKGSKTYDVIISEMGDIVKRDEKKEDKEERKEKKEKK
jgi:hypothetical protein